MAIRVVEFSNGRFKIRNNILNFYNWINGEVSKVPKFDQNLKSIFYDKNYKFLVD